MATVENPDFMFVGDGANRIVLMRLTDEKRPNDPALPKNIFWSEGIFL